MLAEPATFVARFVYIELRNRSSRQTSMAEKTKCGESDPVTVVDEPGWAERFQRGLTARPLYTPPKHRAKTTRKPRTVKLRSQNKMR